MLAFMMTGENGRGDAVMREVANRLQSDGFRLAGAVQRNVELGVGLKCHMDLALLDGSETVRISQDLGRGATGCRLDPSGLETAAAHVEAHLGKGKAQLLLVNKFGKQEAAGRGFRTAIGVALTSDIPVLVGVGRDHRRAFLQFAGAMANEVPTDVADAVEWCKAAILG